VSVRAGAGYSQLLAQAEATERFGESEARRLEAIRDALCKRGAAQVQNLLAEADSLQMSQDAVVAQMNQEVNTARTVMNSELHRLASAADSYLASSKASLDEAIAIADAFGRNAAADAGELAAAAEADRKFAQAEVEHMRVVSNSTRLSAQAAGERILAQGRTQQINSEWLRNRHDAAAFADARISSATFGSQFARDFVSTSQTLARIERSTSAVKGFEQMTASAFANLDKRSGSFQHAAQVNWDTRLAGAGTQPVPGSASANPSPSNFGSSTQFSTVPTDSE
ncbi:MAG: hypothetical protein H7Y88_03825, partial [Phycisphaerales bacterium]|nr:hypothetical protein [Phycisphaerales bacterium]